MGSRTQSSAYLVVLVVFVVSEFVLASVESDNSIEKATNATGRSGRNDYVAYSQPEDYASQNQKVFYSSEENDEPSTGFKPRIDIKLPKAEATPAATPFSPSTYEEYMPEGYSLYKPPRPNPRYHASSPMHKSRSSVNWNVWKGDTMEPAPAPQPPAQMFKGGPSPDFSEYYFPADAWKGDAWKGDPWPQDQTPMMMMMMNQMQAANRPKLEGFLAKLTKDPAALVIAAILPFSIILAAILPTLVNMMMNGGMIPTVSTTASGNNGRNLDGTEFLSPLLTTITTFGGRAFDNPDCMQRIFCQVTKGSSSGNNGTEGRAFQRSLYSASKLIDSHWLETFGVKTLFDSMEDGNCEKIPCSTHGLSSRSSAQKNNSKKT